MAKPAIPTDITTDAEDFLNRSFEIDYDARPSAQELLRHSWTALQLPKSKINKSGGSSAMIATVEVPISVGA